MLLQEEREKVVAYCQKMGRSGLTPGTSGNISIASQDRQHVAISPSAMDYDGMSPKDVVVLAMDGSQVDSERRPSSEWNMHLACYLGKPEVGAVVHTHSSAATTVAVLGWDLPSVHYMLAYAGSSVVKCAPYRLFGTPELAAAARAALGDAFGCLLANHGVLARGLDISHAYGVAEQIEYCADVYLRARSLGDPNVLSDEDMQQVISRLFKYQRQA
jgi:L-fuculose-phosphate aldolase